MQKEDLVAFIQEKSQECLLRVDEPGQKEAYFFWMIMEVFCKKNGVSVVVHYVIVEAKFSEI